MIIFDLDGTLVHTRDANLMAYRSICVEPPADFHTRHWSEWTSDAVHEAKQREYERTVRTYARLLPLINFARQMSSIVITISSPRSIAILVNAFEELRSLRIIVVKDKIAWLQKNVGRRGGMYFDDDWRTCDTIEKMSEFKGVQVCRVRQY